MFENEFQLKKRFEVLSSPKSWLGKVVFHGLQSPVFAWDQQQCCMDLRGGQAGFMATGSEEVTFVRFKNRGTHLVDEALKFRL